MKNEKQTEKDFNDVIEKTYKWVEGSSYFDKYDTLQLLMECYLLYLLGYII